jgi:DNA-binding Lrp family transcriptional regulator
MPSSKINDRKLLRMIDKEGMSQSAAAKAIGCSRQAVHQRLHELRGQQTRAVATAKINESVDAGFDAMRQLTDINTRALDLLDQAEGDPDLALKCIAEVRQQIKLASDIYERMFNIEVVHDFMGIVAETLREVDPHVYQDFKNRINEHRSVRSALRFS